MRRSAALAAVAVAVGAGVVILGVWTLRGHPDTLRGKVIDEHGVPIAGAIVRIQASETATATNDAGEFRLHSEYPAPLSAQAEGYYIGGGETVRPGESIEIRLHALPAFDDRSYEWLSVTGAGEGENQGCAVCHSEPGGRFPVDGWLLDAHGGSARNPRFLSMYDGTDLDGNRSPPTRFASSPDYGRIPLPPDVRRPYFGPGYRLDFPDSNGNCGACHVPMVATRDPYGVDPGTVSGTATEGIGCDFCHKISDVRVDPDTGLPDPGMPGVLSIDLLRPSPGHQVFFGPLDDVAPGEDVYSPLQHDSRYCAACHFGVFWGTVIYDSYGEWLRSPYSDPETGATCQDCHMPPTGADRFALESAGGLERDPETLHGHLMPGAADEHLLRNAVTLTAEARRTDERVTIEVTINNDRTGHHIPTDSPLRHLILLVEARDATGPLTLVQGPTLPDWCGTGERSDGQYAGLPGTAYAKVLEELWTEIAPTGAYWNPTRVLSDNRIPALSADTTTYVFAAPTAATIEITLFFRRAFIDLMEQKGWNVPDIEMADIVLDI